MERKKKQKKRQRLKKKDGIHDMGDLMILTEIIYILHQICGSVVIPQHPIQGEVGPSLHAGDLSVVDHLFAWPQAATGIWAFLKGFATSILSIDILYKTYILVYFILLLSLYFFSLFCVIYLLVYPRKQIQNLIVYSTRR